MTKSMLTSQQESYFANISFVSTETSLDLLILNIVKTGVAIVSQLSQLFWKKWEMCLQIVFLFMLI